MSEKIPEISYEKKINKKSETGLALDRAKKGLSHLIKAVENGKPVSQASLQLIQSELEYAEEQHYEAAFKDPLTGLLNRRAFEEELGTKIERAKKFPSDKLYAFYIDIDKFKSINDIYGHDVGDSYLKIISVRINNTLRPDDTLVRMGGDEFAVLCFVRHNPIEDASVLSEQNTEASQIAARINQALSGARQELNKYLVETFPNIPLAEDTGSVGYSFYDPTDNTQSAKEFINKADKHMYQMKKRDEYNSN